MVLGRPTKPLKVEARCRSEHRFQNTTTEIGIGTYTLKILPRASADATEAILEFDDHSFSRVGHSHPQEEARIVLDIISVLTASNWAISGFRVNGVDAGVRLTPLEIETNRPPGNFDLGPELSEILRFDGEVLTQFVRSCRAFSLALTAAAIDISLAFLLMVTAVECLAGLEAFIQNEKLNRDSKRAERYCEFIRQFCNNKETYFDAGGEPGFIEHLKTIYYVHRSAFVHAGREVSIAAQAADSSGFPSILHYVDGRETKTPGLAWFARIVRASLRGFVAHGPKQSIENPDALAALARGRAVLTMRFTGPASPPDDRHEPNQPS